MHFGKEPNLVFRATSQQVGSRAAALLKSAWLVRGLVRASSSSKSIELEFARVELVQGGHSDL